MFDSKKEKNSSRFENNQKNGINIISVNTKVEGNINLVGDLRIDGEVEGDITGDFKVVIGDKGVFKGTLSCKNAEVNGQVVGNLIIENKLTIHEKAEIKGDIKMKILVVEPNAVLDGSCTMIKEPGFFDNQEVPKSKKQK